MNDEKEIWKEAYGLAGYYEVSTLGNLRRCKTGKNAKMYQNRRLCKQPNGYMYAEVFLGNGRHTTAHMHRLIAQTFLGVPENPKMQVNHKNGDKTDNRLSNLEWVTQSENMRHAQRELGWVGRPGTRVVQVSLDGTVVAKYDSTKDASMAVGGYPVTRKNISAACSQRHRKFTGKRRYAVRGYLWFYEDDLSEGVIKETLEDMKREKFTGRSKELKRRQSNGIPF